LSIFVNRLLGQVRRRFGGRTVVRRRGLWRPGPRIRIEFGRGGQTTPLIVPATHRAGLTASTKVC